MTYKELQERWAARDERYRHLRVPMTEQGARAARKWRLAEAAALTEDSGAATAQAIRWEPPISKSRRLT